MIRRPPRSTLDRSSAASDVYKRQERQFVVGSDWLYYKIYCGAKIADNFLSEELKSITAVSYTHLRAHETVLDLVCRLLLEKKKNTNHKKFNSTAGKN